MTGHRADHEVMTSAIQEVAELLFGDGADELVRKMNPTQSDLAAKQKRERTQAQVGLASNLVGITAGTAATAEAAGKFKEARRVKRGLLTETKAPGKIASSLGHIKTKHVVGLAAAGLGLQAANVAGDAIANRVLARSAKAPQDHKKKIQKNKNEYATDINLSRGKLAMAGVKTGKKAAPVMMDTAHKIEQKVQKDATTDITWEGEFSKFDTDKKQVFGWASVVEIGGEPVVDRQGDYISPDEIEKAAYSYVVKSRKGGDMHQRTGEVPMHVSDMIESFMVTPEKLEKMGLPSDSLPTGWWVGYQINDDKTWDLVKKGERTGFSIHGRGKRKDL